jgi:hypothetical protein
MWAAGIVSPYGWAGWKLPLALFGRIAPVASNIFSLEIAENRPLTDLLRHQPGQALPFLFLAMVVIYGFDRARARFGSGHLLLFAAFAALGCMAMRNLPLSLLAGLMALGRNLQVSLAEAPSPLPDVRGPEARGLAAGGSTGRGGPSARWGGWMGLAAMMGLALLYGPKLWAAWEYELPGRMETPFRFPEAAADYLEAHPLPGGLFNELRYGGYLEFRLYPEQLAFVDGRMILRSPDFYRDFLAVVDHPEGFPAYRARYGLTHALLPISEDRRFLPLAASLLRQEGWTLLYCDGASALLADSAAARVAHAPVLSVSEAIHSRFAANPRLEAIASANAEMFLKAAATP